MNWVDFTILAVIGISALISLVRGFVREAVSILILVAAFLLAKAFAQPLAARLLAPYIESPLLQVIAAFAVIFTLVLIVGGLLGWLAGKLVESAGLTGTDRAVGVVFGALRGLLIVVGVMLLMGLTPMPQERWWRESQLLGHMQPLVCKVGVGEWMANLMVYSPVAQREAAVMARPAAEYWDYLCGAPAAKTAAASVK